MFEGPDVDLLKSLPYLPSFFAQPLPPRYAIDRTEEPLPDLFLDEERLKSRAPQVNTTEPETATKETTELLLNSLASTFNRDVVEQIGAIYHFEIEEDGSVWILDLKSGAGEIRQGAHSEVADVRIVMQSHGVLAALASGNMHPRVAYLSGRFKVIGDTEHVRK